MKFSGSRLSAPTLSDSYLARPASPAGQAVLVLHAWWGLSAFVRGFCDRLARRGFVALAPDLYHGATASTVEQAKRLRSRLKRAPAAEEIGMAAKQLVAIAGGGGRGIGVVGFSLGGYWALWLADQRQSPVAATVVFYGARSGGYLESHSAFQFHLAEVDEYVADSAVKRLKKSLAAAGRPAEFHTYPGAGHWFFEKDRPEAYQAQAATPAWVRTVRFLEDQVG